MATVAMIAKSQNLLRRLYGGAIYLAAAAVVIPQPVNAAVFAVNSAADVRDAIPGDGICLTVAGTCTLRAAIEESNALPGPDVINVPAGNYLITLGNGDDNAARGDFDVRDTLTINGAGRTLSVVDGNNADRVFDVHQAASLQISALTIANGNVNNQGGGIRNEGSLIVTDVLITDNAGKDGGGVSVRDNGSSATFTNVEFFRNSADKGGGLHVKDGAVVTISQSIFRDNNAQKEGGGAYLEDGVFNLTNAVFDGNTAEDGGGIFTKDAASIIVANAALTNNVATKEGGGAYVDKSITRLERSLIAGNDAEDGGGLFIKGGGSVVDLENVTISGNVASKDGGGIQKEGNGIARLLNVTVNENSATQGGGLNGKDGVLTIQNSIVAGTTQGGDCDGTITSLDNNLDSDSSCQLGQPADLPGVEPQLGTLLDNGGPTLTHALADFSPARDAGSDLACPGVDQRGQGRPVDGNADGIAVCDMGAYEAEPLYPEFDVQKSVDTQSDPISGGTNPKALPGAMMQYTISISNAGPGAADQDSMIVTEALPPDTYLVVADFDAGNPGPVAFVDGVPPSGLMYSFDTLDSVTDDIEFSDDGGASYVYVPTPDAYGADPNVTHFRILPKGAAPFSGADPVVSFLFKVLVR